MAQGERDEKAPTRSYTRWYVRYIWSYWRFTFWKWGRSADVRQIVKQLDPDSGKLRKHRRLNHRGYVADGPKFVWHLDRHDKLKLFAFSIHSCIDKFLQYLIWREVVSSNKKPELIAKFYLDAVKSLEGILLQIKIDNCTEHSLTEPMYLHLNVKWELRN